MGVCDEGILSPYPPCIYPPDDRCAEKDCCAKKSQSFRGYCETSTCCRGIGRQGPQVVQSGRARIMLFAAAVSVACAILQLVPVISISTNRATVVDTAWVIVEADFTNASNGAFSDMTMHIGVEAAVLEVNGTQHTFEYSATNCLISQCEDCKNQAEATIPTAIVSFISSLAQVATDIQRSTAAGDLNCQRTMGLLTGVFGFLTTMSALQNFMAKCGSDFKGDFTFNNGDTARNVDYKWGPTALCLLIATLLKVVDVVCHLAVATPPPKHRTKEESEALFGLSTEAVREILADKPAPPRGRSSDSPEVIRFPQTQQPRRSSSADPPSPAGQGPQSQAALMSGPRFSATSAV